MVKGCTFFLGSMVEGTLHFEEGTLHLPRFTGSLGRLTVAGDGEGTVGLTVFVETNLGMVELER